MNFLNKIEKNQKVRQKEENNGKSNFNYFNIIEL